MEQQPLCLIYYCQLVCFWIFLSYSQKIYFLLSCCHLFYDYLDQHFHSLHHCLNLYNSSTNFHRIIALYSNRLYIGIAISRSLALSMNMLLVSNMHDLNGALFPKVGFLFLLLSLLVPATLILFSLSRQYMYHYNYTNLISDVLLTEYWPPDTSTHFLVANFDTA